MLKTLLVFLISLASLAFGAENLTPDYYSIQSALNERDVAFGKVPELLANGTDASEQIRTQLATCTPTSPWYNLLLAETETAKQPLYADAIRAAGSDYGKLWVLFLEFHKKNERVLQDRVLEVMERTALENGVERLPAVAEQLRLLGQIEYKKKNYETSLYYLQNSERFGEQTIRGEITQMLTPGSSKGIVSSVNMISKIIGASWKGQVLLVNSLVSTILMILLLTMILAYTMFLVLYFTKALHPIVCRFPLSIPYTLRFTYATLLLLSLLAFGVYPVLLIVTVLLLRTKMKPGEMIAMRIVAVIFLLSPFALILNHRMNYMLSTESPLSLYEQALYQLPSESLFKKIEGYSKSEEITSETKALHLTSMALIRYKESNFTEATTLVTQADSLWPSGEPVLLARANILYGSGNQQEAYAIFKKSVEILPNSPEVNYNFGQISLDKAGIVDGTEYITKATSFSPVTVNRFIHRNSKFFGELQWPTIRRFFLGAVSTETLQKNFMALSVPPKAEYAQIWGFNFIGLPFVVSVVIMFGTVIISSFLTTSHMVAKKQGDCPLCGKPICGNCRIADICNECSSILQEISNPTLIASLKIKLSTEKRNVISIKAYLADIIIPGTRDLFLKAKSKKRIYTFVPLTLLCYLWYAILYHSEITLFGVVSSQLAVVCAIPCLIYNGFFLMNNLKALVKTFKKGK